MKCLVISLLLVLASAAGHAEEAFVRLDVGRGQARVPLYVMSNPQALATLVLLPGGDAGTGKIVDRRELGKPVWLVGTSRGSVSAAAAAIALGDGGVQGLVLTSSAD